MKLYCGGKSEFLKRAGLLASLVLLLAGCAADPAVSALRDTQPKGGMARLVLYYPAKIIGGDGRVQVQSGGKESCMLDSGNYVVSDITPGDHGIVFAFCGLPATSSLKLKAAAGEKYYVRLTPYDSSLTGILSGYPGEYTTAGEPAHKGPFAIERIDEPAALDALRYMKKVDSN